MSIPPVMSGSDDCHQQKARHLHGQAAVNSIGFRRRHPDACSLLSFSSRTVMAINSKRVDRRNRAANRNCTPTCETIGVNVELTCNVRPDISGSFGSGVGSGVFWDADGAFSPQGKKAGASATWGNPEQRPYRIFLSANGNNSTYGRTSSVQPNSIRALAIIKI